MSVTEPRGEQHFFPGFKSNTPNSHSFRSISVLGWKHASLGFQGLVIVHPCVVDQLSLYIVPSVGCIAYIVSVGVKILLLLSPSLVMHKAGEHTKLRSAPYGPQAVIVCKRTDDTTLCLEHCTGGAVHKILEGEYI